MAQPKQPKKKPLGAAITWTDADLDHMAEISPTDLKAAEALWRNEAPQRYANLLSAEVIEKDQGTTNA